MPYSDDRSVILITRQLPTEPIKCLHELLAQHEKDGEHDGPLILVFECFIIKSAIIVALHDLFDAKATSLSYVAWPHIRTVTFLSNRVKDLGKQISVSASVEPLFYYAAYPILMI
jgi:hypothetical protein